MSTNPPAATPVPAAAPLVVSPAAAASTTIVVAPKPAAPAPAKAPRSAIRVANKLGQSVTLHARINGKLTAVTIPPHGESAVMDQASLESHAHQLIAAGHLRVRRA